MYLPVVDWLVPGFEFNSQGREVGVSKEEQGWDVYLVVEHLASMGRTLVYSQHWMDKAIAVLWMFRSEYLSGLSYS